MTIEMGPRTNSTGSEKWLKRLTDRTLTLSSSDYLHSSEFFGSRRIFCHTDFFGRPSLDSPLFQTDVSPLFYGSFSHLLYFRYHTLQIRFGWSRFCFSCLLDRSPNGVLIEMYNPILTFENGT